MTETCGATTVVEVMPYRSAPILFRCDREPNHEATQHHELKPDGSECFWGEYRAAPDLPMRPDPNAVKIAPGTTLHHGLYLRGEAPDPDSPPWEACKICGGEHWTKDHPAALPEYGWNNPAPGTSLWRLRNHPETMQQEDWERLARAYANGPDPGGDESEYDKVMREFG
jgi:hypothetical protein